MLATASGDTTVKIWSVKDFACIGTFEGHQSSVIRVLFLSRGMQLASAGSDGLVKIWNLKSSENVATIDAHESKVFVFFFKKNIPHPLLIFSFIFNRFGR